MNSERTVDAYLDRVSYKVDKNYVPSTFAIKMINFIKLVTDGKGESSPSPIAHYKVLDKLANSDVYNANLIFRGSAKSTLNEYLILFLAVYGEIDGFGKIDGVIFIGDTMENGVKSFQQSVKERYNNSEFMQQYVPDAVINQSEMFFTNVRGGKLGVRMFGASSGIRGTKIFAKRPQLLLADDLLSDKNAKSDTILKDISDTLNKGAKHALDPTHRKVILNGTPFNEADPLYVAINSGSWNCSVFPVCEKWPCTRKEFRGMWPERFSYDFLQREWEVARAEGTTDGFMQELMLRISAPEDRLIQDTDIMWYSRNSLLRNPDWYNWYITTDFATTKKDTGDYSSINVWAINAQNKRFWVDGVLARQLMDKNIDDLFFFVRKYKPLSVGIETNGQQGGFISLLKREMTNRNLYFGLAKQLKADGTPGTEGIHRITDKLSSVISVIPEWKQGNILLPEEINDTPIYNEIMREIRGVTRKGLLSAHDDWLDGMTQLFMMETYPPMDEGADEISVSDGVGNEVVNGASMEPTQGRDHRVWGEDPFDTMEEDESVSYFV